MTQPAPGLCLGKDLEHGRFSGFQLRGAQISKSISTPRCELLRTFQKTNGPRAATRNWPLGGKEPTTVPHSVSSSLIPRSIPSGNWVMGTSSSVRRSGHPCEPEMSLCYYYRKQLATGDRPAGHISGQILRHVLRRRC